MDKLVELYAYARRRNHEERDFGALILCMGIRHYAHRMSHPWIKRDWEKWIEWSDLRKELDDIDKEVEAT